MYVVQQIEGYTKFLMTKRVKNYRRKVSTNIPLDLIGERDLLRLLPIRCLPRFTDRRRSFAFQTRLRSSSSSLVLARGFQAKSCSESIYRSVSNRTIVILELMLSQYMWSSCIIACCSSVVVHDESKVW